jgi:ribonuclease-3
MHRKREVFADMRAADLEEVLGYRFKDGDFLQRALTHPSCQEGESLYERLEFLGDAIMSLVASDLLYRAFPEAQEGVLSKMRASLVNARTLAAKAKRLRLGQFIRMGKGEEKTGGREKPSVLAAAFEVIAGAIYIDGGIELAWQFLERQLAPDLRSMPTLEDHKTTLQEFCQRVFRATPTYRLSGRTGPAHNLEFETEIFLGERCLGRGKGKSKKEAEQDAAREAMRQLGLVTL